MEKSKKMKIYRAVGLVALTIIVIGAIVGIMYAVNSKTIDKKAVNADINATVSTDNFDFKVTKIDFKNVVGDKTASSGKTYALVTVEFLAKKDYTIRSRDFNLSGQKAKKLDGCFDTVKMIKDDKQQVTVTVAFETKSDDNKELFLYCYGYRVRVGSSANTNGGLEY